MAGKLELNVDGRTVSADVAPETPLLYVLRNDLQCTAPRFGCGLGQCGACTVQMDGEAIRSCATPVAAAKGTRIKTLAAPAAKGSVLAVVQQAFIDEQAAQCGYCLNGWILTAASLLERQPTLSEGDIRQGLSGLKCRCGTHMAILRAVKLAQRRLAEARA